MRVFLSYSSNQQELAEFVASQLRALGIEPGNMHDEIPAGADTRGVIKRHIQDAQAVIALVTPDSLHSDWLSYELGVASGLDRQVIPIVMDVPADQLPKQIASHASVRLGELGRLRGMFRQK